MICPDSNYGQIVIVNSTSDDAINDWGSMYNKAEHDLINYPKINLWSLVKRDFMINSGVAINKYKKLSSDTTTYFSGSNYLNRIGYDMIHNDHIHKGIEVFVLAITEDPLNANLYDSTGEAYFIAKDYDNSRAKFKRSLELNPDNDNAVEYLQEIDRVME